jgi:hypothetical protein
LAKSWRIGEELATSWRIGEELAKSWRIGDELATSWRIGEELAMTNGGKRVRWNYRGTLTELSFSDNQIVMAFFGTIVELWWNFGGTLNGV